MERIKEIIADVIDFSYFPDDKRPAEEVIAEQITTYLIEECKKLKKEYDDDMKNAIRNMQSERMYLINGKKEAIQDVIKMLGEK